MSGEEIPAFRKHRILACVSGVSFMIMLDSNIVAVSLPAIARSLGADFASVEWVVSAYILAFASCLMTAGSLADRYGRRRVLILGLALFTLASGLCGLARTPGLLNAARGLQGMGAALQLSAALAVLGHTFRGAERARAYAVWGTVIGVAVTSGPIIGGLITSWLGWQYAFLINLPVGLGLLGLAVGSVPESRDPEARRLDYLGAALLAAGIFLLVWAVIGAGGHGWASARTWVRLALGGALLLGFILAEARQERPMMDLSLFRDATFLGSSFSMLGFAAAAQVMMTFLPLYLQTAYGSSPAQAGLRMLPFALPLFLCPRIAGRIAGRFSGRAMLTAGLIVVAAGDLFTALAAPTLNYGLVALGMTIVGCGAGFLNGETARVQMSAAPPERGGMVSGISATTRFIGLLFGVAGLGAVLTLHLHAHFLAHADLLGGAGSGGAGAFAERVAAGNLSNAIAAIPEPLRATVAAAARTGFAGAFSAVLLIASLVAGVASALSWMLIRYADTKPLA
ncbi:MAG: MFS transporter [Holophaga sp.]|nr:MFS transporter [Holophaga sp.]